MPVLKYLQLPFFFDAALMQQEVQQLAASYWHSHYQTLQYEGEWTAIPLRSADGSTNNIFISPVACVYRDTPLLDECNYIRQILATFQCPLQAVRLLKLNAGAIIKEHKDLELCFEKGEIRIHIPVVTNEEVEFYLDKERMFLKEGECWYMNFNLVHNINNFSKENRIHLVIDAVVNDWVKEQFSAPTNLPRKEISDQLHEHDDASKKQMVQMLREMNTETSNRIADEMEVSMQGLG